MSSIKMRRWILSGFFLALCLVLPFLTGQIPQIGSKISPMHIPVLICGFVCGAPYGMAVGFVSPLLRSLLLGMPPMLPTAAAMAFELAAYGLVSGLLYRLLPKRPVYIYVCLVLAMLAGRVVWGLVSVPLYLLSGSVFSFSVFIAGGFINALPGIALHILLIPPVVMALKKARLLPPEDA